MARRKSTKTTAPETNNALEQTQQDRVTLVGRLCADPVLHRTKSGKAVSTIRIAVNTPSTEATFHSVVVWERTAEVVCEYLRKGRAVEVTGHTQKRSYDAADGTTREVIEIVAHRVQFLSRQALAAASDKEAA